MSPTPAAHSQDLADDVGPRGGTARRLTPDADGHEPAPVSQPEAGDATADVEAPANGRQGPAQHGNVSQGTSEALVRLTGPRLQGEDAPAEEEEEEEEL